jgi:Signal peptidase, peptidase S26
MNTHIQMADVVETLLRSGTPLTLPVSGSSMKPLLQKGARLRIIPCKEAPLRGDIVLYRAPSGRLIAHRVVGFAGEKVRTKGDSSRTPDPLVDRGRILGLVIGAEGRFVPLRGPLARRVGLLINRYFPRMVRYKAALRRRLTNNPPRLAGENG